jgi:hypothetical protein
MTTYHGGNSGVLAYNLGPDFIVIQFKSGERYVYNHAKPGPTHVKAMKWCATHNAGLATYINQHVRGNYAVKLGAGELPSRPTGNSRQTRGTPRTSIRAQGRRQSRKRTRSTSRTRRRARQNGTHPEKRVTSRNRGRQ